MDPHQALRGIFWVLDNGAKWEDLLRKLAYVEFLQFVLQPNVRLARTSDELLAAVIDCLRFYEVALRSEERYKHLWDIKNPALCEELDVAKDIVLWLDQHLFLAVSREANLFTDERPDILVQATWPYQVQPVTVVIELKRDCHRKVFTVMDSQLRQRYLEPKRDDGWIHSLYLVAWMPPLNSRRNRDHSMNAARAKLDAQARSLSHDGLYVTSFVLDARYPRPKPREPRTSSVKYTPAL